MFKGGFYIISTVLAMGTYNTAATAGFFQKPNGMKIDSVAGAPGNLVSIPLSVTNALAVGILDIRLSYDPVIESLHSVTPAIRVANWEYFEPQPDTSTGEIHIIGLADTPIPGTPSLMQPGSGPVAYLNFKVYDQSVVPGFFSDVSFLFQSAGDNAMYDSLGNQIDSSQVDYVNGGIHLGATSVKPKRNRPADFWLAQNFPNPFNPQTRIDFFLPVSARTSLVIYDLLGRTAARLIDEVLPAGPHSLVWSGRGLDEKQVPSGTYLYRLISGDFSETKKMVLVK
jgi:hypothetical protein